jgi:flagellar hook-basal body complex protein FliE
MDALSALKMMAGGSLTDPSATLTKSATALSGSVAPSISPAELQTLSSDAPQSVTGASASSAGNFQNLLGDFVGEVNDKQIAAQNALTGMMSGQGVSLHQAMISMEEANVSFQMMIEVRNKVLDSYQELMRMQI